MDYESKYNELVEAIRTVVDDNPSLFNVYDDLGRLRDLLPQKESEDERIRKDLIAFICQFAPEHLKVQYVAYLEKLKKQKSDVKESFDNERIEDEGVREEIIQFFKDASNGKTRITTSETLVKWIKFLEKQKDNKFTPRVLPCSAAWFEDGEESEQKEQKPTEWSEDFEENIRNLLHDKLTGHSEDGNMSWATLIDDKTLKDIVNGIWFYVGKEALKYPNKELSQPEWSEEEKGILLECISVLQNSSHWLLADRLSSLRPQPHWKPSEEHMKALSNAINIVGDDIGEDSATVKLIRELYDDLESFLTQIPPPHPHWEPSEQQMEALRKVTYKMGNSCFGKSAANDENLHSLYVALKKLM